MKPHTSLFAELQRRNVFRAATFYAASAWLLVEVVTQLSPVFDIPDGVVRWIVIAALVGFPFAMLFSWLYEWTPTGIRRESEIQSSESISHLTARQLDRLIIAVLLLATLLLLANKLVLRPRVEALVDHSIAVLPLMDEVGGKDGQYFSDGLSENLIAALSRFHGLKVINRNSSFQFRGSKDDSRSIGRKLGAAHLLEGSVRREGDQVQVVLELIRAADGSTLWSQRYQRPYNDLFALQDQIAAAVASALEAKLVPGEAGALNSDRPPSGNLIAYNAYLQGKFYQARNTEADFGKAIHYFREATRLDPRYARAWSALSLILTRNAGRFLETDRMQQGYADARTAVDAALALQPNLAAAHMARGTLLIWSQFNWVGGEAEIRRGQELDPHDDAILLALGEVEAILGHVDRAVELTRQALSTDTLNARAWHTLATYQMSLGQLDDAENALRQAMLVQPGMFGNHEQLAIIGILRGDADGALREADLENPGDWRNAARARALQIGPDRAAADSALATMIRDQPDKAAYQIAQVQALRKDGEQVFASLERAWSIRDPGISLLLFDPLLQPYRSDPRFAEFCKKVGLPFATAAQR
ncbi:MAG: tetratricopeptide repeat protein [Thermomonas sp.]